MKMLIPQLCWANRVVVTLYGEASYDTIVRMSQANTKEKRGD